MNSILFYNTSSDRPEENANFLLFRLQYTVGWHTSSNVNDIHAIVFSSLLARSPIIHVFDSGTTRKNLRIRNLIWFCSRLIARNNRACLTWKKKEKIKDENEEFCVLFNSSDRICILVLYIQLSCSESNLGNTMPTKLVSMKIEIRNQELDTKNDWLLRFEHGIDTYVRSTNVGKMYISFEFLAFMFSCACAFYSR